MLISPPPSHFVPPSARRDDPRPERRRGRYAGRTRLGRIAFSLLLFFVRAIAIAFGVLAAWLVIVGGLMAWFLPAQLFGWVWAALFILPGMALGLLAVNAAEAVMRIINRLGDRLLYGAAAVRPPPSAAS